ncbi:MAG: hypothetical protein AAFP70_01730, partial [Calditrichota bacterium]
DGYLLRFREMTRFLPTNSQHFLFAVFLMLYLPLTARADSLSVQPGFISLRAYVESGQVPMNRNVVFNLELSWTGDMSRYQITDIPQPILTNLLMEGSGSTNRLETVDGQLRSTKMISYKLRPVEEGMAFIDGLEVNYIDTQTRSAEKLQSQRVMVEILEPVSEGGAVVSSLIYWILLGIFLTTIAYFIMVFLKKRRARAEGNSVEVLSPEQSVLKKISQEIDPKGSNLNDMVLRLSGLFTNYLGEKIVGIDSSSTADDLLKAVTKSDLQLSKAASFGEALNDIDLVRFAGKKLQPHEFSAIYNEIESFLLEQNSPS